MDEDFQKSCDEIISINGIKKCIGKLKENNDGIISEFYKYFQEDIIEFIFNVFNEAIDLGVLPVSMTHGLISVIPKPNKHSMMLENWRPITIMNNDGKILAFIFAERLKKGLDQIIDDTQSGFMKGRHMCNNI